MCLNPGLELLSTSRLSELSSMKNDVSLDFLEKENKNFPGGTIRNMEKDRGMRLVEDDFQWSKLNPRNEISTPTELHCTPTERGIVTSIGNE
jgi:hypothetical protein